MRQSIRSCFNEFTVSAKPIEQLMHRIHSEASLALKDPSLRSQHHAVQCGSVVLLSGYLESFIRSLCENYFTVLSMKGFGMAQLGQEFLDLHLRQGAVHLADLVKREGKQSPKTFSNSSEFVRKLVAPIADATKSPTWEAFARTQGNPSPEVLKSVLRGLGIRGGLPAIEAAMKSRYSAASTQQFLQNLVDIRNECAHTGSAASIPAPSTVLDLVYFTRVLVLGVCRVVDQKITDLAGI
jgi:hypothetical protein